MSIDGSRGEVTSQVKEKADIVEIIGECVTLKRSGARFLGLCPFHGEKTPSFSVHASQQYYYCFGCGESGDVFSFLMKYHGLEFPQALKMVADRYHIVLPEKKQSPAQERAQRKRELLYKINEKATQLFERYLQDSAKAKLARKYLQNRGVSAEIISKYRLGYAPSVDAEGWNFLGSKFQGSEIKAGIETGLLVEKERGGSYDRFRDRIVFPIMDVGGRVCGFGGRIVGQGQPKYLNSPESLVYSKGDLLLGLFQQKDELRKQNSAVLVEGNFDLISLVGKGVSNVVAPLGTALTREQLRLVKRYVDEVVVLFDGDEAGINAAIRSVPFFLAEQLTGRVALLPSGHDPDTYVSEYGGGELQQLIDGADPLPEFALDIWVKRYGLSLDGKQKIVKELKELIIAADSPLQRSLFISHFSEKLGVEKEQLTDLLGSKDKKISVPPPKPTFAPQEFIEPLSIPQRQLVEFMVLQPQSFVKLEDAGLRGCLEGGIGEVVYLQIKNLLHKNPSSEPEELLTAFPAGTERGLVSEILFSAADKGSTTTEEQYQQELEDLLDYLRKAQLKRRVVILMQELQQAQNIGDAKLVGELMQEQVSISRRIHGEQE